MILNYMYSQLLLGDAIKNMSFLVASCRSSGIICFLLSGATDEKFLDEPLSSCSMQNSDVRLEVTVGNVPLRLRVSLGEDGC